ncbi:MAG: hypothetical protein H7224_08560 [Polaromonas sp.]|nr:hypothetical protein [Polaromonas sp.]
MSASTATPLPVTAAFLHTLLVRPELAPVPESCAAELDLHAALLAAPDRPVSPAELTAVQDADARNSYTLFLRCRSALLAAGSLPAYYRSLFPRQDASANNPAPAAINIPPLFIDLMVDAMLREWLALHPDPYLLRAADLLHRPQRVSVEAGQVLSGDQAVLDMYNETSGLGDFGRFLAEAKAPLRSIEMKVLSDDNAAEFFAAWQPPTPARHRFLLDLTHEVTQDLSHGLVFTMTRARSGLKALAAVLVLWVQQFLGVEVRITPLQKIDDEVWRWHIGLDAGATALLNDLYEGREVAAERLQRLVSLFRLEFVNPLDMRADVAGKPVYLALTMAADGVIRLKPQNLLVNLPLRSPE